MAGFLDFVENYVPGGAQAVPAWLTGLLVKKPKMNMGDIAPYYQQIADSAAQANQFAEDQARFYDQNYRPAAVQFNARAQGVGHGADLNEAADRNAANYDQAFGARQAAVRRDMAGINPNSGGAMARRGALDASYATGKVDALNKGRREREQYGDTLRKEALPFLATAPNHAPGMYGMSAAATGMTGLNKTMNDMYRQEAGDTVKALKLPGDYDDERRRKKENDDYRNSIFNSIRQRFPSDDRGMGYGETDATMSGDSGFQW